jgi:hypothetical protein
MSASPQPLSEYAQNRYISYPHTTGFADGGSSIILGQIEEATVSLWKRNLVSAEEVCLATFPVTKPPPNKLIWFDVAYKVNKLAAIVDHSVWLFDLNTLQPPREVYRADASRGRLNPLPSISADGTQMVLGIHQDTEGKSLHSAVHLDMETGATRLLFEHNWFANHFHFSPADSRWIGFCHEGHAGLITDRVWAWNSEQAPQGRCLYNQALHSPGHTFCLGHERCSFHKLSIVVPAYGESTSGPRGLYELFPEGAPARLISQGDRDWHCDVSRDGRWAVVDTTGPHDVPGLGWENALDISDILLIDMQSGARTFLGRSRQHRFHPRHPHPAFSPDGSAIFYNEAEANGPLNRVMQVANPWYISNDAVAGA